MPPARFLNVDLEIESKEDLRPLAVELGDRVLILFSEDTLSGWSLGLEYAGDREAFDSDDAVLALAGLIEGLSPANRALWDGATLREFNAGFDVSAGDPHSTFSLQTGTLQAIATAAGTLRVTVYPQAPEPA